MLKICRSFLCCTQQLCSQPLCYSYCVVPEKNPTPPHGRSMEIPRLKEALKEAKYEAKLKISWGGGSAKQENLLWGE